MVGDLTTARIMIEDGAYFKGSIEIDRKVLADLAVHEPQTFKGLVEAASAAARG